MNRASSVTESPYTYAIGYIHGRADLLRELLFAIERRARWEQFQYRVVFLGNLIDLGPASSEVVDLALAITRQHPGSALILGRHEAQVLRILDEKDWKKRQSMVVPWFTTMGGEETLMSYGTTQRTDLVDAIGEVVDPRHIEFFRKAKHYVELDHHVIVHASLKPGVHLIDQDYEWLLRPQREFLDHRESFGKKVIHGQPFGDRTGVENHPNRIAINDANYALGALSAVCVEPTGEVHSIRAIRSGKGITVEGLPLPVFE
ncbi:serine/threonine protein phosphatase [Rhizobium leguminosarum]|uniref:serine/threonine protein phosphatase n=1 Tax=Rhizobium leguminosarum TaxID=384 RepID=UPI000DDA0816|nr:serine/threonine protein phosphatase [Rhizobium leguminosarum]MBY5439098.1 serine/threonine protein phosphatase [Rhizobium leguminosarum]